MKRFLRSREAASLGVLIVIVLLAAWREPRILEPAGIRSVLLAMPILLAVALGELLVLLTRGVDVSVGSSLGLAGIVAGMAFRANPELGVTWGLLIALCVGALLGLANGLLIALARVPPIIATLGSLTAYRGLTFIVSGGKQIDSNNIPDALTGWSLKGPLTLGGVLIPWTFLMTLGLTIAVGVFLARTRKGRYLYAIGGHEDAARLSGIAVRKLTVWVYVAAGALAGVGGLLYASRYGFLNPATAGQGFELNVIAAVVIGGVSFLGGSGSAFGVFLGCLLLGVVNVALSVLKIDATWQLAAFGAIILIALIVDGAGHTLAHRRLERGVRAT